MVFFGWSSMDAIIINLSGVSCLFYTIAVTSATLVTLGYYSLVSLEKLEDAWYALIGDLHRHCFNSVVILVDVFFLSLQIRIAHYIYILLFFFCYLSTNFMYWCQDPTKNIVYKKLDFNKPVEAFFMILLAIMIGFLVHILLFLVHKLKSQ